MPKPSSIPRGHRLRTGTQSAITRVISTTLIWPNAKFAAIGSIHIEAGATIRTVAHSRRSQAAPGSWTESDHTCRRVNTIIVEVRSNSSVSAVIAVLAAGMCSQAKGLKATAASGG